MASRGNTPLFVQEDEFENIYDLTPEPQPAQADDVTVIDITGDDDEMEDEDQQAPTNDVAHHGRQQRKTIDSTGPDMYRLVNFSQPPIPKHQVYERLQAKYSEVFSRQAKLAIEQSRRHRSELRAKLEEAANMALAVNIRELINRDRMNWHARLKTQEKMFKDELAYDEKFLLSKSRAASRLKLRQGLLKEDQDRVTRIERDLRLRGKLVDEMKVFARQEGL